MINNYYYIIKNWYIRLNTLINKDMKESLIYLLLTFIIVACSSKDEPATLYSPSQFTHSERYISPQEAGSIASAFMMSFEKDNLTTRSSSDWYVYDVQLLKYSAPTRAFENDTTFYVVDFKTGGYVLVAADRYLDNKIYVFSPSGQFGGENNPMLDVYIANALASLSEAPKSNEANNLISAFRKPMKYDRDQPAQGEQLINGKWYKYYLRSSHKVKNPLLKTEWHQGFPYNFLCVIGNGQTAAVGCVAVAMGQICSYHRKPQQLNNHTYDWDAMLAQSQHSTLTASGIYDIAHLLRNIGGLVNMNYGIESSGASFEDALDGFKKMGYSNAKKETYAIGYVTSSLLNNVPVYMRGKNPIKGTGHAWVVDGYDLLSTWTEYYDKETGELYASTGGSNVYTYLHFNAGWGSTGGNAYYLC